MREPGDGSGRKGMGWSHIMDMGRRREVRKVRRGLRDFKSASGED